MGRDCRVGAGAVLMPGSVMGEGAALEALGVATQDQVRERQAANRGRKAAVLFLLQPTRLLSGSVTD